MLRLIKKSYPHRQANGNDGEAAVHRFIHGVWWILKTHDPDGHEKIEARLKQINGTSKRCLTQAFINGLRSSLVFGGKPDMLSSEQTIKVTGPMLATLAILGRQFLDHVYGTYPALVEPSLKLRGLSDSRLLWFVESFNDYKEPWWFYSALGVISDRGIPAYFVSRARSCC